MKTSLISAASLALFAGSTALANLALPQVEMHSQLTHEEVNVEIKGDEAVVTGTFKFSKESLKEYYDLTFYLPVYAVEGTAVEKMQPTITMDGKALEVVFVKKEWENARKIREFGEMPQLEGQRVYWFLIPHVAQQPEQKELTIKISYKQSLSNNKFIYTPLIPHQKESKDYGGITITADRPYKLVDVEKHSVASPKEGVLVVEPSDKRAIIVECEKVVPKLP